MISLFDGSFIITETTTRRLFNGDLTVTKGTVVSGGIAPEDTYVAQVMLVADFEPVLLSPRATVPSVGKGIKKRGPILISAGGGSDQTVGGSGSGRGAGSSTGAPRTGVSTSGRTSS